MIEIYQKKRKRPKRLFYRENYHILRSLGRIPTRYTIYEDYTPEQKQEHLERCKRSHTKRYAKDSAYRKRISNINMSHAQRKAGLAKNCSKCNVYTAFREFSNRNKGTLRPECNACRSKYNKERYELKRLHQG